MSKKISDADVAFQEYMDGNWNAKKVMQYFEGKPFEIKKIFIGLLKDKDMNAAFYSELISLSQE
ncbi:MAG: hypothetical protein J5525_13425 [Lachnospiraceae bacterium]|nr:hypothetical protein [Lachnospiraceae bacterium]